MRSTQLHPTYQISILILGLFFRIWLGLERHLIQLFLPTFYIEVKGEAIPVTDRGGPYSCDTSRLSHFLDNRLTDGGDVSLTRRPPFIPRKFLVLISVRGSVDLRPIVRLEELGQMKNPMTSWGIESMTFRFVA
jgi:hypothetical protein